MQSSKRVDAQEPTSPIICLLCGKSIENAATLITSAEMCKAPKKNLNFHIRCALSRFILPPAYVGCFGFDQSCEQSLANLLQRQPLDLQTILEKLVIRKADLRTGMRSIALAARLTLGKSLEWMGEHERYHHENSFGDKSAAYSRFCAYANRSDYLNHLCESLSKTPALPDEEAVSSKTPHCPFCDAAVTDCDEGLNIAYTVAAGGSVDIKMKAVHVRCLCSHNVRLSDFNSGYYSEIYCARPLLSAPCYFSLVPLPDPDAIKK